MKSISVVIPTCNRLASLRHVLAALGRQTLPADEYEVVVVCDGATDGTPEYLAAAQFNYDLRWFMQHNLGAAAARNRGVAGAQGDLIVFLDDDVVPDPCLLWVHATAHAAYADEVVVIGTMLTPPGWRLAPWSRWSQDRLAEQYAAMSGGVWAPTPRQFYTGNASLSRRYFELSGGFDTRFRRAEDVEMGYRLATRGMQFVFCPEAVGYHYEDRTFAAWLAIPYDYGRNDVVFSRDLGHGWLLSTILREYRGRSLVVRCVTWLCLDRPGLQRLVAGGLRRLAQVAERLKWSLVLRVAFSGLFNLYHYQGVADGLGGRRQFFRGVARGWA